MLTYCLLGGEPGHIVDAISEVYLYVYNLVTQVLNRHILFLSCELVPVISQLSITNLTTQIICFIAPV